MLSLSGACLWNVAFCVWYISLATSSGLVSMCPCVFCKQSSVLLGVGWKIFLWIVLGLMFSKVLYFVMVFFTVYCCLFSDNFMSFQFGFFSDIS